MLKNISFLFKCSKKHIAIYLSAFASTLGIFLMYTLSVVAQNYEFEHTDSVIDSGLAQGFYQQMIVFVLNSITLLYFAIFVFKSPSQEGYELIMFSRRQTRLNILISRIVIIFTFAFVLALVQLALLSIPATLDKVLPEGGGIKWLFSNFIGNIIIGLIISSFFIFVSTIANFVVSIVLGASIVVVFPLVSITMFEKTESDISPALSQLKTYDVVNFGSYLEQEIGDKDIYPTIESNVLVFKNIKMTPVRKRVLLNGSASGEIWEDIKTYNSALKYKEKSKIDGWNAFKGFYNIFSNRQFHAGYKYRKYEVQSLRHMIPNVKQNQRRIIVSNSVGLDGHPQTYFMTLNHDGVYRDQNHVNMAIKKAFDFFDSLGSDVLKYYGHTTLFWDYLLNKFDYDNETISSCFTPDPDPNHSGEFIPSQKVEDFRMPDNKSGLNDQPTHVIEPMHSLVNMFFNDYFEKKYESHLAGHLDTWEPPILKEFFAGHQGTWDPRMSSEYMTVEDIEYPKETPWTIILPILAIFGLAASVLIFMKKDIK